MFQLISGSFMAGVDLFIFLGVSIALLLLSYKKWVLQKEFGDSAEVHSPILSFAKIILIFNLGSFLFGFFIVVLPNVPDMGEFWVTNRGNIGGLFYGLLILPSISYLMLIRDIERPQMQLLRRVAVYTLIVNCIFNTYNLLAIAGIKPFPLWVARRISSTTLLVLLSLYALYGLVFERKRPTPFYFALGGGLAFTLSMLLVNNTYHLSPTFATLFPLNFPSFLVSTGLQIFFVFKVSYDIEPSDFTMWKKGRFIQFRIWGKKP